MSSPFRGIPVTDLHNACIIDGSLRPLINLNPSRSEVEGAIGEFYCAQALAMRLLEEGKRDEKRNLTIIHGLRSDTEDREGSDCVDPQTRTDISGRHPEEGCETGR